ncbi:hypothetical protein KJ865_00085, partial [Myxococcota bacterium]|nr:hypothetical protein [Myxococcota bacterium]
MASESLNKVIQQLKDEGINAAKADAEKIRQKAEAEAEDIIINAEMKAKSILKKAEEEDKKIRDQLKTELERAARIGLASFKSSIEKALVVPAIDESLAKVLATPQFMEKVIVEMVKGFAASNFKGADLTLILPADLQSQMGNAIAAKMKMMTAGGDVTIHFDDNIRFGFKVGPSDKAFVYDLSNEGLMEIFTKFV